MSGFFYSSKALRTLACSLIDGSLVVISYILVVAVQEGALVEWRLWGKGLVVVAALMVGLYYNDLYGGRAPRRPTVLALRIIQGFVASGVILALCYHALPQIALGRSVFLVHLPIVFLALFGWRTVYYWALRHDSFVENVLILGTGESAVGVARELLDYRGEGYRVVGFLGGDPSEVGKSLINPTVVGTYDDLLSIASRLKVDSIIVALDDQRGVLPLPALLTCKLRGINVAQSYEFSEALTGQISVRTLRPSSIIFSPRSRRLPVSLTMRRVVEFLLACVGFLLAAPILVLAAIAIFLESGRPILYRQARVGEGGRTFTLYKLRTMKQDAEKDGAVWASADRDPRITRAGRILRKTRFDELPQLLNVLRGDMSFVGPRPERPCFVEKLQAAIPYYGERHTVRPGITGWAQVKSGYSSSIEESEIKLRYDLYYIKNMSFWLDVQILLDTFKVVLFGRGARSRIRLRLGI